MPETVIKKFNEFNPATGKWDVVERPLVRVARAGRPPQPAPKAAAPVVSPKPERTSDK